MMGVSPVVGGHRGVIGGVVRCGGDVLFWLVCGPGNEMPGDAVRV